MYFLNLKNLFVNFEEKYFEVFFLKKSLQIKIILYPFLLDETTPLVEKRNICNDLKF